MQENYRDAEDEWTMTENRNSNLHRQDFGKTSLREARPEDNEQICALMKSVSMPGPIRLTMDCSPSFFKAVEVEGYANRILVAEHHLRIAGVSVLSKKRMYLNGSPTDIGYVSSVRADPSIRKRFSLGRGIRIMKKWHEEGFGPSIYLGAILRENTDAIALMPSRRAGLPPGRHLGCLHSAAIPLIRRGKPRLPAGIRIERGNSVGAEKIVDFLHRTGPSKQFFPVYSPEDFLGGSGILRGLTLNDFYVALAGHRIVGTLACWNQLPFRRIFVAGYSGYLRRLKFFLNLLSRLLHLTPLPDPGRSLRHLYAACIAVEDNDPQIFTILLKTLLHDHYNTGYSCLAAGLMEQDPLAQSLRKFLHFPTKTDIFAFSWDGSDALNKIEAGIPYMELGGL